EKFPRYVRPRILHAGRQRDGTAAAKRRAIDVDIVVRKLGADIGVERHLARGLLGGGQASRGDTAGDERQESFAEHRDPPVKFWRVVRKRQILHLPLAADSLRARVR